MDPSRQLKLKTQDVSEILRKAKNDLNCGQDIEEEDCVVRETDPDELDYPKHEPTSMHKSAKGASNLSQKQTSPKNATKQPAKD